MCPENNNLKRITRSRFEALAGYIRRPENIVFARELEWYFTKDERVLAVLIQDRIDEDFGGIVLGRDARKRFRAVDVTPFSESIDLARDLLLEHSQNWSLRPDSDFIQDDEKGTPMDVFTSAAPKKRHSPAFLRVAAAQAFSPARALIEAMMPYYEDVDGNFVEQFQTDAFDARFWELYLFALLTEQGFAFDRSFQAPDFFCRRFQEDVFVEAVTVNPTTTGGVIKEPEVPEDKADFIKYYKEYMPMKWGSPLTSKLKKEYWKLPHVGGKPIVFAIQDFHVSRAMTFLSHSIVSYLYGISFSALYDQHGRLTVTSTPRPSHKWGNKEVETGFFQLPNSDHISAVITNPTATISKFNRMAYLAELGSRSVRMSVEGFCHDHDPNAAVPKPFAFDVNHPKYSETWAEGANVYHNPNARVPLDESFLPDAAHHRFEGGVFRSLIPEFHPYQSQTVIIPAKEISSTPLSLRV
jgi:hypothetical protein